MSLAFFKLSQVIPDDTEVKVAGETFQLRRFNMKQIQQAQGCTAFFMQLAGQLDGRELNVREVLEAIQVSAGPAIILASIAAKRPIEWAEELGPDEIVPLLLACVQVNKDFFVSVLRPRIKGWSKHVKQLLA